jgi:hypothetical protein
LIQIFITKEKERALGIQEQVTTDWRRQNNIPDSDGFEIYLQGPQVDKRNRSDTVSTANSDKHDRNCYETSENKNTSVAIVFI